jgi:shikimate dehydrogenase
MKVFCILSDERAFRSKSPVMHTTVLARVGIPGVYVPFMVDADRVGDAVRGLRALNIAGANVTVPYKETVVPFLDTLSANAKEIGAVNTIVLRNGKLEGHNTDCRGFVDALDAQCLDPRGASALVFGTGGAARGVVYALSKICRANVLVAGRNPRKTEELTRRIGGEPVPLEALRREAFSVDLVVNATSVSNRGESPEAADLVSHLRVEGCRLVVDLNYGRQYNFWKRLAKKVRADFMDGLPMLAYQARRSFLLWTGVDVEVGEFVDALGEGG